MTVVTSAPVRLATVVRLMAGRGVFRLTSQLMPIALLAVWGAAEFGRYANAVGLCMWLLFVPTAAEKAALKVLPRIRLLAPHVARLTLHVAAAPVAVVLAALVASLLLRPGSTATLYLAAAGWSAATGLLMTIAGLHRLSGRPMLDVRAFGSLAAIVVAATAAAWLVRWDASTHLLVLLAGALAVTAIGIATLPAAWVRRPATTGAIATGGVAIGGRPARRLLPAFGRSVGLLGLPELLDVAALSAVFAVLAASGRTADSGPFYLALMLSAVAGSFVGYLLRVHQPATSARLRGTGGSCGRARAAGLLRIAERAGLCVALFAASWLLFPAGRSLLADGNGAGPYLVLGALVVVEIALSTLVTYAGFVLENTNSRVLTLTSAAALVGLVATVAIAVLLVPWLGAVGGFVALVLALAVKAYALRRMLRGQYPSTNH